MKAFAIWIAIVAVVFGGFALVTSLVRDTTQVFVYVDSSQPMEDVWTQVRRELDGIDDRSHAEFALAEGQSRGSELVHSWQSSLELGEVTPFAPCSFDEVAALPEATEADERILVTTATSCDPSALTDWDVVLLTP